MKNLIFILLLALGACSNNTKTVQILETGEKTKIENLDDYTVNDTIVVRVDKGNWILDNNWIKFDGLSCSPSTGYYSVTYRKAKIITE
jgi:major membrane immunogen (membrane-anchored lipoprotein)